MKTNPLKILFLGSSEFSTIFLKALIDGNMKPFFVITQPDMPVGRRQIFQDSLVKILAKGNKIKVATPENASQFLDIVGELKPDLAILVAYGMIIPKLALDKVKRGFINVHPSLLPKYRGPSPVQTALLDNQKKTGVSIILLDEKVDHGPLIAQKSVVISANDNNQSLHNRLALVGADLLLEVLPKYIAGQISLLPQDDNLATMTRIITREDGHINWHRTAPQISQQFRAFYPWPGLFTYWGESRLKIADLSVLEGNLGSNLAPGTVFLGQNREFLVKCSQGVIWVKRVQLAGKKELDAGAFLRGYKNIIGAVLDN